MTAEAYIQFLPEPPPFELKIERPVPEPVEEKPERPVTPGIECNCYAYVKHTYFPQLPNTATIRANLTQEIGGVAVFYYPNSGVYHYAKVLWNDGYYFGIDEANFSRCKITQRLLNLDYPRLLGFYAI